MEENNRPTFRQILMILWESLWFSVMTFILFVVAVCIVLFLFGLPFGGPGIGFGISGMVFMHFYSILPPILFLFLVVTKYFRIWTGSMSMKKNKHAMVMTMLYYLLSVIMEWGPDGPFWWFKPALSLLILIVLYLYFRKPINSVEEDDEDDYDYYA